MGPLLRKFQTNVRSWRGKQLYESGVQAVGEDSRLAEKRAGMECACVLEEGDLLAGFYKIWIFLLRDESAQLK